MRLTGDKDKMIEAVFEQCFTLQLTCFTPEEQAPRGMMESVFRSGQVFVSHHPFGPKSQVSAFAIVDKKHGEPFIWSIAVHPGWRNAGIGSKLLAEIEEYAREQNAAGIGLTVQIDNPAQKLYFDKGYRVQNVLKNYYLTGHGLFMRRKLI
jgi:ribosomal protein S18 acetylase RimI-like enzyme